MMKSATIIVLVVVCMASGLGAETNLCCISQPEGDRKVVEKVGQRTLYRAVTKGQSYTTSCGLFGWRRCGRYRQYTVQESYNVDVYQIKTYPQPCKKYACCHGYTMVKDICYANHEVGRAVGHVADIKESVKGVGNVDLKDVFGAVHGVVQG